MMKKILCLFILSCLINIVNAQTYIPFPTDINTTWLESRSFKKTFLPNYINCFELLTKIKKDTIMNGLKYYQIYHIYNDYTDHTKCISNSYTILKYDGGYIRNDSINKKVYYKSSPSTPDTLLYDFDLQIGQLYPETYLSNASPHITSDSVIAIDSVYLNSKWHKRFTLQKNKKKCNNTSTYYLIEGIGGESGFWSNGNCDTLYNSSLKCLSIGNKTIYPNQQSGSCSIITSLRKHKLENKSLKISPNPTLGWLNIQSDAPIHRVLIYNAQGQQIKEILSVNKRFQLPSIAGIYILRIQDKNGLFYSKKVVKR